jgi:arginyl-tRNA synthetase
MEAIKTLLEETIEKLYGQTIAAMLSRPDPAFGDFATNVALKLAGKIGKNPREIADEIAQVLPGSDIAKAEVAGPGFINLTLSPEALIKLASREVKQRRVGETVVIETNNPNPFKAMHIGHAFNAIVADTIANLIAASGAHTYRVSYHGDVGLHVGKSMYSLLKYVDGDARKLTQIPEAERNSFMFKASLFLLFLFMQLFSYFLFHSLNFFFILHLSHGFLIAL